MSDRITWEELLGGGDFYLIVRQGQLLFVWPKDTSIVKLVRCEEDPPTEVEVAFELEVPPGLRQDPESFVGFCREFVGTCTAATDLLTRVKDYLDGCDYESNAERDELKELRAAVRDEIELARSGRDDTLECTNSTCDADATGILACLMVGPAMYVAPYCDEHAAEIQAVQGGLFACGPALSDVARLIEGRRA